MFRPNGFVNIFVCYLNVKRLNSSSTFLSFLAQLRLWSKQNVQSLHLLCLITRLHNSQAELFSCQNYIVNKLQLVSKITFSFHCVTLCSLVSHINNVKSYIILKKQMQAFTRKFQDGLIIKIVEKMLIVKLFKSYGNLLKTHPIPTQSIQTGRLWQYQDIISLKLRSLKRSGILAWIALLSLLSLLQLGLCLVKLAQISCIILELDILLGGHS